MTKHSYVFFCELTVGCILEREFHTLSSISCVSQGSVWIQDLLGLKAQGFAVRHRARGEGEPDSAGAGRSAGSLGGWSRWPPPSSTFPPITLVLSHHLPVWMFSPFKHSRLTGASIHRPHTCGFLAWDVLSPDLRMTSSHHAGLNSQAGPQRHLLGPP